MADQVSAELSRRKFYVVIRGTTHDYEWVNVLGIELESAEQLLRPKALTTQEEEELQLAPSPNTEPLLQQEPLATSSKEDSGSSCNFLSCFGKSGFEDSESSDDEDETIARVLQGWLTLYTSDDPNSPCRGKLR